MNQFDDFFEKKLNSEQEFTGQNRSWSQLNHDLHVFEKGTGIASKSLAIWKVVGVVATLIAIALVWERQYLVKENKQLKLAINDLEIRQTTLNIPQQEMAQAEQRLIQRQNIPVQQEKTGASAPLNPNIVPSLTQKNDGVVSFDKSDKSVTPLPHPIETLAQAPAEPDNSASVIANPVELLNEQPKSDAAEEKTMAQSNPVGAINAALPNASETDSLKIMHDSVQTAQPSTASVVAVPAKSKVEQPAKLPENPVSAPVIDPVHSSNKRWRAGVQVLAGFSQPNDKGVSEIIGQGVGISYRFWNNFSVTTAVNFLKFEVNGDTLPKHFADVDLPPAGPGHHLFDLENVSSDQVMQQYTVGLSYAHQLIGRWNVSLNTGHSWAYLPSRLMSLKFEEEPPVHGGGPGWHPEDEYLTIRTPKNWVTDIWRLGAGLQYETPGWSFGLKGDYSKRMNKVGPAFDAIFVSADVMFKF